MSNQSGNVPSLQIDWVRQRTDTMLPNAYRLSCGTLQSCDLPRHGKHIMTTHRAQLVANDQTAE